MIEINRYTINFASGDSGTDW